MSRISERLGPKEGGPLLHGYNIEESGKNVVTCVILNVREAPRGFSNPFIIDFDNDVMPGIASWAPNQTQCRILAEAISDTTENWRGWGLALASTRVNEKGEQLVNPTTGKPAIGIRIVGIKNAAEVSKQRKSKPKYKLEARKSGRSQADSGPAPNWDDLPF